MRLTRMRAIRERQALTQDELAEKAGVSRQTVVKIEGGLEPRPPTIRKLAEALGVEPSDLMQLEHRARSAWDGYCGALSRAWEVE